MSISTGGTKELRFKDGGFGSNNPSIEVYYDIINQHDSLERHMGPFISIGTGTSMFSLFSESQRHLPDVWKGVRAAFKTPTLTAGTHRHMVKQSVRNKKKVFPYFRFDGGLDLGSVGLDEFKTQKQTSNPGEATENAKAKTLNRISNDMVKYLSRPVINKRLRVCARLLVQRRRLRARDDAAWERYAVCLYWVCDNDNCLESTLSSTTAPQPKQRTRFRLTTEFEDHLCKVHGMLRGSQEIEDKKRECRSCSWVYPSTSS